MGQPPPALAAVDADLLETLVQVPGQARGPTRRIEQDDHADASRLPVHRRLERERLVSCSGGAQHVENLRQLPRGSSTEERERDMEVLTRYATNSSELIVPPVFVGPALEGVQDILWQPEREEEPE